MSMCSSVGRSMSEGPTRPVLGVLVVAAAAAADGGGGGGSRLSPRTAFPRWCSSCCSSPASAKARGWGWVFCDMDLGLFFFYYGKCAGVCVSWDFPFWGEAETRKKMRRDELDAVQRQVAIFFGIFCQESFERKVPCYKKTSD